jgi:hypothetical protein
MGNFSMTLESICVDATSVPWLSSSTAIDSTGA